MNIGIIGAGKVGIALGHVLQNKGFAVVAVASRREESLELARKYIPGKCVYTKDATDVVREADVIAVTTQDRQIHAVATELFQRMDKLDQKLFFHTSGAHPAAELSPLEQKGAMLGSLHPLQTFPDVNSGIVALPRTYIFIEGDERAMPVLDLLASTIGFKALRIESRNKVLYHLSAVFVCNLLSALMHTGEGIAKRIGIELTPFFPIIETTLRNIENKGPLLSLTGPVVRGDAETVLSHLKAIQGMEPQESVYRLLSRVALEMAGERKTLTREEMEKLESVLKKQ
ncbi:MAG TPA: Rossmann-like and DUF2520 domain-containing protein [Syntrophorhabdales bacterium]|nr:Rossmann-like and DUF2520 domain-containing protein [Syntrophorhabdales bacterium]